MRTFCFCVLGVLSSLSATSRAQEPILLVRDGQPLATIIVPAEAGYGERQAARELQTYVKKCSGAELPIQAVDEAIDGISIVLGDACRGLKHPAVGDGFTIETVGKTINIAGGNQRGTLYGVYAFLEDELGIRWYTPDKIGEVVPRSKTIRVAPINRQEQPDFEYRWIGSGSDWSARNRNNVGLPEIGVNVFRSAHTFQTFLDPKKYFAEHPEWFALVGGERRIFDSTTHLNQICTSNPEAVEEVIKNMRAFLDKNPETDMVTLFPNDGMGFCECDACKALDEPGWATVEETNVGGRAVGLRGYGTLSRRMMIFNNAVAKALYETHPKVMVKVGAYSCYTSPPKDRSLTYFKNVIVQICHSWCHNHAICDTNCEINADFRRSIEGWSRIAPGGVMLYEYYYKVAQCELPYPIIHAMRKDLPYFKSIGVKGVYTQYSANWGTLTLPYYVSSRLLWNCEQDVDQLVEEFYEKFYGPAAEPMKRYYERLERAAIASGLHFSPPYYHFPEVFTSECLDDCRRDLEKAKALADSKIVLARLAMVQTSLDYTSLVMDYVNAVRKVDETASGLRWKLELRPDAFAEATKKAEAVREFMSRPEAKNVLRKNTNYVSRLLNPSHTFQARWDRTDPQQLKARKGVALTRGEWIADADKKQLGPISDKFDLWIFGYDFDAAGEKPEHDLHLLDSDGARVASLPLPPKGQTANGDIGCVVYPGLDWPGGRRDALRLEVVNRPGDWTSSTLLAVYVMPSDSKMSRKKADELIRNHPNWPRDNSIGFVEFGSNGMVNDELEPTQINIELIGGPRRTTP